MSVSEKIGGYFSKFLGGVESGLPQPRDGTPTFPQGSARRMVGVPSVEETERVVTEGRDAESLSTHPGWIRYFKWLCEERDKCLHQLAVEDFGKENDKLKAVQLRLSTLNQSVQWISDKQAAGKEAAKQLTGGK